MTQEQLTTLKPFQRLVQRAAEPDNWLTQGKIMLLAYHAREDCVMERPPDVEASRYFGTILADRAQSVQPRMVLNDDLGLFVPAIGVRVGASPTIEVLAPGRNDKLSLVMFPHSNGKLACYVAIFSPPHHKQQEINSENRIEAYMMEHGRRSHLPLCSACGKLTDGRSKCGHCFRRHKNNVYYCDRVCQELDWGTHKPRCFPHSHEAD